MVIVVVGSVVVVVSCSGCGSGVGSTDDEIWCCR